MKTRVISAAVLLVIAGFCMFLSPVSRALFFCVAGLLAACEFSSAQRKAGRDAPLLPLLLYLAGHTALCFAGAELWALVALFVGAVLAQLVLCVLAPRFGASGAAGALLALCYPAALFAVLIRLSLAENWLPPFAVGALATWFCDAFALFGGMRFGKRKLAPHVSPNKTVEGALCGALASLAGGALAWLLLQSGGGPALWVCLAAALISSSLGQFGDLAASLFKREAGIKDYSNLIPGHGGMLDRADSLLFAIPTAWLCLTAAGALLK